MLTILLSIYAVSVFITGLITFLILRDEKRKPETMDWILVAFPVTSIFLAGVAIWSFIVTVINMVKRYTRKKLAEVGKEAYLKQFKITEKELFKDLRDKLAAETENLTYQDSIKRGIKAAQMYCHTQATMAGWHDNPRETGTMLMLIVSEIAEAMEGDRKGLMDDHLPDRKMFEVELADACIRIFDLAGRERIDLAGAIIDKLDYNRSRADHKPENREKEGGKKY